MYVHCRKIVYHNYPEWSVSGFLINIHTFSELYPEKKMFDFLNNFSRYLIYQKLNAEVI